MRKKILVIVGLVLALGACGNSDKKGATGTSTNTSSNSALAGTDKNSPFCKLAAQYQNESDDISNAFKGIDYSNPDKAKQQLADAYRTLTPKYKKIFGEAVAIAPADIKPDLQLLGAGFLKFLDALEKADYDFAAIGKDPSVMAAFQDPKFKDAADRVGKYGQTKCGIAYTPDTSSSS